MLSNLNGLCGREWGDDKNETKLNRHGRMIDERTSRKNAKADEPASRTQPIGRLQGENKRPTESDYQFIHRNLIVVIPDVTIYRHPCPNEAASPYYMCFGMGLKRSGVRKATYIKYTGTVFGP